MSSKDKTLQITLVFTEDDLNTILKCANFGDGKSLTVNDVIKAGRWEELHSEIQDSADEIIYEIVEGSREACANGWLESFSS
mgnify:CR=1 FL=1